MSILHLVGQITAGVQAVHVTLPPPDYLVGNIFTNNSTEGLDDLEDGGAGPSAEVEDVSPRSVGL